MDVILEGKVPFELRTYFFGAELIVLNKTDGAIGTFAVDNVFRRLFESRQARHGSRQVGVAAKRDAEFFQLFDKKPQAQGTPSSAELL